MACWYSTLLLSRPSDRVPSVTIDLPVLVLSPPSHTLPTHYVHSSSLIVLYHALLCQLLVSSCSTDLGRLKVAPHSHHGYDETVASLLSVSSPTNDPSPAGPQGRFRLDIRKCVVTISTFRPYPVFLVLKLQIIQLCHICL
jgi:hypothetical protein